jgi:hypothetical protein
MRNPFSVDLRYQFSYSLRSIKKRCQFIRIIHLDQDLLNAVAARRVDIAMMKMADVAIVANNSQFFSALIRKLKNRIME